MKAPLKRLTVTGPPGVELVIFDGLFQQIDRGSERLAARLKPGLYVVRWVTPDAVRDQFVNLDDDAAPRILAYPVEMSRSSGVGLSSAGPKSRPTRQAAIVILEQGREANPRGSIAGVRLFNASAVAMRSDSRAVKAVRSEAGEDEVTGVGWAVRVYPVDPGLHRLHYETVGGAFVDQVVPAIRGRRTVVVLRQITGQSLVSQDGGHAIISTTGADPSRTVILTTPQSQTRPPTGLEVVLAQSLLDGTMPGSTVTTLKTIKRCSSPRADPLLRIYAAAGIVAALDRNASPVIDQKLGRPNTDGNGQTPAAWRDTARALLAGLTNDLATIPDVAILQRMLGRRQTAPPSTMPMLACCLDWIRPAEADLGLPGQDFASSFRPSSAGPWMIRTAESAKSGEVASSTPSPAKHEDAWIGVWIAAIALTLGAGLAWGMHGAWNVAAGVLAAMGALLGAAVSSTRLLEAWAAKLEYSNFQDRQASRWNSVPDWIPRQDDIRRGVRNLAIRTAPPFIRRPVLYPDDANKSRFGGLSEREGFRLTATFRETDDPKWVEITLTVAGGAGSERRRNQRAHFFLHDTYDQREVAVSFVSTQASVVIRAFGGFTVGVWLPGRRVELELDLAEMPDAPQIIKDW